MSNEENTNMGYRRGGWGWKCLFILPLVALAIFGIGYIVMSLWNCVMPSLFPSIGLLTYWHAIGLLILSKILFGGFHRHHGGWRGRRRMNAAWKEKWANMSEEEKAKFKDEWKTRCQGRC
ncbi:MAG TPA: HMG-box domain-containing protein [Bacteroidia bacterium]|jgi:hypothetical protein|nr:HMG-box domain-containing protein [Bacteroidia bacterium]